MLFSVIVPVYKVEKYIRKCVESVLSQTFSDWELILVDDGSPDECPFICDEYAKADPRIRVVHKPNGGLASARQAGIRVAEGDYVFNLDSDDAIEADTLETAYDIITKYSPDIVSFGYQWVSSAGVEKITNDFVSEGYYDRDGITEHIYPGLLMNKDMEHISYYLSGKAVRRTLLTPNQLAVNPKISLGEDLCCVIPCYLQAQSVYISKKNAYLYTMREDSLSKDFNSRQILLIENVINELCKIDHSLPCDFYDQLSRYSCFMCFAVLASAAEGNHYKSVGKLKEYIIGSIHGKLIGNATFSRITPKSRIAVFLIRNKFIKTAFCFLNICALIKSILKRR